VPNLAEESHDVSGIAPEFGERVTVPDRVAAVLRDWIFGGQLPPGERILEGKLAQRLRVAQPTVREALRGLESEGLVTRQTHRGCSVTKFSPEQWNQAFDLRLELEMLAAQWACKNRNKRQRQQLLEAYRKLEEAGKSGRREKSVRADIEFHTTIWRFSGNEFLVRTLSQIAIPMFAFGTIAFQPLDYRALASEHKLIALAVISGDAKEARRVTKAVLKRFKNLGDWSTTRTSTDAPTQGPGRTILWGGVKCAKQARGHTGLPDQDRFKTRAVRSGIRSPASSWA
jgi:DNA-binding GntR family transcriptional regulator